MNCFHFWVSPFVCKCEIPFFLIHIFCVFVFSFNRLDIPPYENYDKFLSKLTCAVEETCGFAVEWTDIRKSYTVENLLKNIAPLKKPFRQTIYPIDTHISNRIGLHNLLRTSKITFSAFFRNILMFLPVYIYLFTSVLMYTRNSYLYII